jgi:Flp pilus assembly pilin Flp
MPSPGPSPRRLRRLLHEETGQAIIEYGGVALLVSIAVILVLSAIGLDITEIFDKLEDATGLGTPNSVDSSPGTDDASAPAGVN